MMAGQTINDRLLAARHSIAGQGLAKSVCKATTEEMIAPKKKHLDYLVHCTNEPNVSIPQLANLLVERTQNANWVVVYKALLTVHHLLAYGNERFTQYLASSTCTFQLSNFLDKSGVQGAVGARIGYDMSPFIRRYAKYLNEKALSYRTVAFDFCKVKRGKEEGSLRMMSAEKLLKTLPVLQAQLDSLLEFDCSANDLTNGVVNMCFMLLFRDLIRLFACYNDGIINLLEKYFDMNKKNCRDALDLYKKFLIRMDRVGEFLKVAENVGIDKGDIPDLTRAPSSLLEALEGHLAALEGRPRSAPHTPPAPAANNTQKNMASVMGALSSTSTAFGNAAANDKNGMLIDDSLKRQALAEEEAAINQYKNKVASPTNSAANNPFLAAAPAQSQNIVDLFGPPPTDNNTTKASDDLLSLGNPFADMFGAAGPSAPPAPTQWNSSQSYQNDLSGDLLSTASASASTPAPSAPSWSTSLSQNYQSGYSNQNGYQNPSGYHSSGYQNQSSYQNPISYQNEDLLGNSTPTSAPFASDSAPLWSDKAPTQGYVNENYLNTPGPTAVPPLWPVFNGPAQGRIPDNTNGSPAPAPAMWPANGANGAQGGFVSDDSFSNVFSNNDSAANPFMGMGDLPTASPARPPPPQKSAFDDLEDAMRISLGGSPAKTQPVTQQPQPQPMQFDMGAMGGPMGIFGSPARQPMAQPPPQPSKVLTGDLDSSLASLANNLTINKTAQAQKPMNWNSPKAAAKNNWTPQPMQATTGAGYRPMNRSIAHPQAAGVALAPAPHTLHTYHTPHYIMQQPMVMGMQQPMMGQPMRPPIPPQPAMNNQFS